MNARSQWGIVGQCNVYNLSWELTFKMFFVQAWWKVRELLSRNNEIILQIFMKQGSTKVPNRKGDRVVIRIGIWSQLEIAELVAGWDKWAWVDHKQLSWRQGAYIWCYKGEERREEGGKRWDAKTCRGDLCNNILNRHEQSKMCCQGKRGSYSNSVLINELECADVLGT